MTKKQIAKFAQSPDVDHAANANALYRVPWYSRSPDTVRAVLELLAADDAARLQSATTDPVRRVSTHSIEKYPLGEAADDTGDA